MTTAPAADQRRLLDVQALDTRLAQLAHRRRTLPEHAALEALEQRRAAVADQLVAARTIAADVQRELAKAEADVEQVRQRAARDQAHLDSGRGSAKDLQGLQHELQSLARRQAELEDVELEVMERAEQAEAAQRSLETTSAELDAERAALVERRDAALAEIDEQVRAVQAERDAAAAGLDVGLMSLYEKVREQSGGVGAAALRGRRCEGCRLELNQTDLQRIRSAGEDEVVRCEECRRILVRVPEAVESRP
ncbi:MAG: zinc ribbon domain-containing protein [Actinomycetota bacterium]